MAEPQGGGRAGHPGRDMATAPALAIILAAGKSTRMKSVLPKVVHEVCGRPMVEYVIEAVRAAGVPRIVLVVGHGADTVRSLLADQPGVEFALQSEQKGTGHAVMMCREHLAGVEGPVFVLAGDTPLLKSASLTSLLRDLTESRAACVIGSALTDANEGLGRIVRDGHGLFERIVEHKDATPEQRAIREINTGCYAFDGPALLWRLTRFSRTTCKGSITSPIVRPCSNTSDGPSSLRPASIYTRQWGSTRGPSLPRSSGRSSSKRSRP